MIPRPSPSTLAFAPLRVAWLLGWAIPEPWFAAIARQAFPDAEHVFIPASRAAIATLESAEPFDRVIGYSLGALLLLSNAPRVRARHSVDLLAPIFAFPREEALGGRMARTQVRYLTRWLQRDPIAALRDFYTRAGLSGTGILPVSLQSDFASSHLLWGLERLERDRVSPPLPVGWRAWCGADDALLDAAQLHAIEPRIEIVPGATHHPAALIGALLRAH